MLVTVAPSGRCVNGPRRSHVLVSDPVPAPPHHIGNNGQTSSLGIDTLGTRVLRLYSIPLHPRPALPFPSLPPSLLSSSFSYIFATFPPFSLFFYYGSFFLIFPPMFTRQSFFSSRLKDTYPSASTSTVPPEGPRGVSTV
ncbi:hypothetical protein E2C01_018021 [Portunus trituberculatus]|uniref:Uncharacterized protein n=1 Tax=Portunus trituberculatus TaxID=210409 RepID=A0A5B7DU13_PORTR|nr:hypothetical protein [Portunus trituberculatus]